MEEMALHELSLIFFNYLFKHPSSNDWDFHLKSV